jgi:peptide/nickel transport system ATP-binding protein/oligopeptide transport system ATP-binding protein
LFQESDVAKTDQKLRNLKTCFYTEDGVVSAVDGVNFEVYPGEVLGIVGEPGCGNSVTSLSIMRSIAPPHCGQDLL